MMNFGEERSRQELAEVLELLELSERNQKLAETYLDTDRAEDRELLKQAEPQDFSELSQNASVKSRNYIAHCLKKNQREEVRRFVSFCAAAGGSTAYYIMVAYGWRLDSIREFLNREQIAAIQAEGIVWNNYAIRNIRENMEEKNPDVLRGAMKCCYHKHDNAKVLLAALSLYYTKPYKPTGILEKIFPGEVPGEFSGEKEQSQVQETVDFLEDNLVDSIPNLFHGTRPADSELEQIKNFIRTSSVTEPFPQELYAIFRGKSTSDYLLSMLAAAAFLAIEHSRPCAAFMRMAMAVDYLEKRTVVLQVCLKVGGNHWFFSHIQELEEQISIPREDYMLWCLKNCKYGSPAKRIIKDHPETVRNLIARVSSEEYMHLLNMAKNMNPMLYQELNSKGTVEFYAKVAEELAHPYRKGRAEVKAYLTGEGELETLYPYVKEWREWYYYDHKNYTKIHAMKKNENTLQMYRRAIVLEGLCMRANYFVSHWNGKYQMPDHTAIQEILEIFDQEELPAGYQLEALSGIYDHFYQEESKTKFINQCVIVLRQKQEKWGEDLLRMSREGIVAVRFLCIRVMEEDAEKYKKELLACAMDSSKMVRELLAAVYAGRPEWEADMKQMLASKKSQEREIAVQVLKQWGVEKYQAELSNAYEREKSKKIKSLLAGCLGLENESSKGQKEQSLEDLTKEVLKGGRKRKISWVYEGGKAYPPVHKQDGSEAAEDDLAAVLVCYADMSVPGVNQNAGKLAAGLVPEELALYVETVFERWMELGAEAKKKWVLYAASIHGGERIIPVLHAQIQEWPKVSRGAMAAEAVKALSLNGSPTALLLVDQISRKFKFRQVKNAASEALTYAAKQLGITKAELEDRIVPSLGFDEKIERMFDYGPRSFKVLLTPALELEVYDEKGKRLKNLPAPGKKDDPEKAKAASDAYKLLKKQLKTVITNQKLRLEQALSSERLWEVPRWRELFVKNPVMHQFAIGLIWGTYEDGKLKDTFRYMEDGSFNTVEEEEYELPEDGKIGLVHPIELEEDSLEAWKEQLSDYEVVQPMEQLDRTIYRLTEEEKTQTELTRFGGKVLNCLSLSGKLQNLGWYRGSVQDAGGYYTFYREDGAIGAELEFSGAFIGGEYEDVTVYGVQFYQAGTVQRGSYVYDTIKDENLYRLQDVSPRYLSEIILQLTKATVSSQEQLPYPECKKR